MVGALGPALGGRGDDAADQVVVGPAVATREDHEIAVDRVETGERVDLDEVRQAGAVAADVDARDVAAAERAVDVEREPLDIERLRSHPRIVFTPHSAFYSVEGFQELRRKAAEEVRRILLGERPRSRVDNIPRHSHTR